MGISVFLLWLWNLFISFLNARGAGLAQAEVETASRLGAPGAGWNKFMLWCAKIMAGIGFTWCLLIALGFGAHAIGVITVKQFTVALQLGYILIVPLLLGTGAAITVDSWATAFREGGVLNYGVAAYNTFAQVHNTYSAIQGFGGAFKDVTSYLGGSGDGESDENQGKVVVIVLVVAAVVGGVLITYMIIQKYAGSSPLLSEQDMRKQQSA